MHRFETRRFASGSGGLGSPEMLWWARGSGAAMLVRPAVQTRALPVRVPVPGLRFRREGARAGRLSTRAVRSGV